MICHKLFRNFCMSSFPMKLYLYKKIQSILCDLFVSSLSLVLPPCSQRVEDLWLTRSKGWTSFWLIFYPFPIHCQCGFVISPRSYLQPTVNPQLVYNNQFGFNGVECLTNIQSLGTTLMASPFFLLSVFLTSINSIIEYIIQTARKQSLICVPGTWFWFVGWCLTTPLKKKHINTWSPPSRVTGMQLLVSSYPQYCPTVSTLAKKPISLKIPHASHATRQWKQEKW